MSSEPFKITRYYKFINEQETTFEWTPDVQKEFDDWQEDGNVIKNPDGTYSTQDAQWKNKIQGLDGLKQYFIKEFRS